MFDTRYFYDLHSPEASGRHTGWLELFRFLLLFCAGGFAVLYAVSNGWALPTIDQLLPSTERLEIVVNKSSLVRLHQPVSRVSIVSPEIADVQVMGEKEILLTAFSVGETSLLIWMEDGTVRTVDVIVRVNTRPIAEAIQHSMPDEAIEVMPLNQGVALRGQVQGIGRVDQAVEIANSYSPSVVNLLDVPGVHQVLLKVKIAEVARTFREEAGFNFQILDNDFQGTSMLGGLVSGNLDQPGLTVSDAVTMFMGLPNSNINAFIQALEEKGLMHILAEPNLVARSGETASFLAGGEFPVPVVQGGGMSNAITIEYKEFGVRLRFTPTVLDPQNVRLDISPEVSDLDFAQGVRVSGFLVPVVVTRRAHTVVSLRDGQAFAIAGLISKSKQKTRRKVPFVSDIPMLGGLFRGGDITEKETELLIMVTPHLVAPLESPQPYAMPGDSLEGGEPNPFVPEEDIQTTENTAPLSPVTLEPSSAPPAVGDRKENIPTLVPQNPSHLNSSKTRHIQSPRTKVSKNTEAMINNPTKTHTPADTADKSNVDEFSAGSAPSDQVSVNPMIQPDLFPASIPDKTSHKEEEKVSVSSFGSAVISKVDFLKPGLMPAGDLRRPEEILAVNTMGAYKDSSSYLLPQGVIPKQEDSRIILASRLERN